MSQHLDTLKICERTMAGVLSRFSFATVTTIEQLRNSSNNEKHYLLVVGLEKVVFRERNC